MVFMRAARRRRAPAWSTACSSPTASSCRSSPRWRCWPAARGLAEIIARTRTQIVTDQAIIDFATSDVLGIPVLVWIFALVAVARLGPAQPDHLRPAHLRVGGNPEAARLAGINVRRHTVLLYVLSGLCCGHRRRHDHGADDDRRSSTHGDALRARRHRRRRHRRHAAHRRPRHDRRHRARRADLHHDHQRLHPQQPASSSPGHRQGRDHRRRRAAAAARATRTRVT